MGVVGLEQANAEGLVQALGETEEQHADEMGYGENGGGTKQPGGAYQARAAPDPFGDAQRGEGVDEDQEK